MSKQAEIRSLTGLRGVAALLVGAYHFFYATVSDPASDGLPIVFLRHGYLSVDLFFVLSGYVMALTYAKLFATGFRAHAFADFLGRRIGRVYPAYIIVTAMAALVSLATTPWQGTASAVTLITNALMVQSWGFSPSIVGPGWSVSTEFAAYLLFPLLVGVVLHGRREWSWIGAALASATLLFIATRSSATLHQGAGLGSRHGPLDVWAAGTVFLVLRCLAGFTLGLAAYRLAQYPAVKERAGRMFAGDIAAASVLLLMLVRNSDVALVLLFVPLIVTLGEQRSLSAAFLSSPVTHWLGLVSYSFYLVHQPVEQHLRKPLSDFLGQANASHVYTASALLLFGVAVVISAGCYYGIEKPGRTWSRHLFRVGRMSSSRQGQVLTGPG